ncbi:MAG TPA: sialate O-acetylesterase [Phycisphaerae bacterium]|nr:sialate O-acetylesterase [Phycisphaerae bacterium]HRW52350.1 sialate O-acetylesterase [Phycisphaerae bacterium]
MSSLVRLCVCVAAAISSTLAMAGDLRTPSIISDHMVLQQGAPTTLWGWAAPNATVEVRFDDHRVSAQANADGAWRATLPPLPTNATPATLTISSGDEEILVNDVLVGEVWLCSGQSNMEWRVRDSDNGEEEVRSADWPLIRHIAAPRRTASTPESDIDAHWEVCTPEKAGDFTAVGYFFGRRLHTELKAPIGLVHCSWGGTRIEPWTPLEGFEQVPELRAIYETIDTKRPGSQRYQKTADAYLQEASDWLKAARQSVDQGDAIAEPPGFPDQLRPYSRPHEPTTLYNGMMSPFVPYTIRGAIWYQGEANHDEGMAYLTKTQALLRGWRSLWERPELPFYFVQIAPYPYGQENPHILPEFWEAQAAIEKQIKHTGMVVISDIGALNDIHPRNKQDVGTRLANLALHRTYGHDDIIDSGPRFESFRVEGDKLLVTFDHVGKGLRARDHGPLTCFEISGGSAPWTAANAEIAGPDTIALSAPGVQTPTAVRFAWDKLATPNLVNSANLPTAPFRAGTPPVLGVLPMEAPESGDYRLVYDLDLNTLSSEIRYGADHAADITAPFDRVAYFMELTPKDGEAQWVFVSMDAFTTDAARTGVPTRASGSRFQQRVRNVDVHSNTPGVPNGTGLEGNLEFWPNNYGRRNTADVPGASDHAYDNGDEIDDNTIDGYGSMQIHAIDPRSTIFAINHWSSDRPDIGIGTNHRGGESDWTFTGSADQYTAKRLRVFVRPLR